MTNEVLKLDDLRATSLPELQGFKETQRALVKECPFIKITDNATYEMAKKHRTALLKGRTALESQDKLIASKLSNFRKDVKTIIDNLVAITLEHETKQQAEVKRFEEIKENERMERERAEELRIKTIKDKIDAIETECLEVIQKMTFQNIIIDSDKIQKIYSVDFDFEEYDILLSETQKRILNALENKIEDLTEKENTRVENERLQKEKAESDAKLKAIEEQQAKEKAERDAKELNQKKQQFEVRKNRLAEIGFEYLESDNQFTFSLTLGDYFHQQTFLSDSIFNCDVIDFENLLTDAKNSIQEAKDKADLEKINIRKKTLIELGFEYKENESLCFDNDVFRMGSEALLKSGDDWFENEVKNIKIQIQKNKEKAEKENQAKSDKENKARIKRLAQDKAIYKQTLSETLGRFPIVFDANQTEVKDFSIEASNRVTDLYNQLLTELHNL